MYEEPEKVTKLRHKIEKALGKERKENRRENIIVRGGYYCCPECEQPIFSAYYEQEIYAFCVGYLEFMHWDFSGKPDAVHNDTDMVVGEPIEDGMWRPLYYCAEKECQPPLRNGVAVQRSALDND